jgi:NADH:ubiquinone oxidoreductase subunit 2 (subunit N)
MIAQVKAPYIDWEALSPLVCLAGGLCVVLLVGLLRARFVRRTVVPFLTLVALGATAAACVWKWNLDVDVVSSSLSIDDLTLTLTLIFVVAAAATVLLSWRARASSTHCF